MKQDGNRLELLLMAEARVLCSYVTVIIGASFVLGSVIVSFRECTDGLLDTGPIDC